MLRRLTPHALEAGDAARVRDVERVYRAWRALLAERREALTARQAALDPEADLTTRSAPPPRRAALDPTLRQELQTVLTRRQQQATAQAAQQARAAQQPVPDPDTIEATLLAHMQAELDGLADPSGQGRAVFAYGDDPAFMLDVAALQGATSDADYLVVATARPSPQVALLALLGIVGAGVVLVTVLVPWAFGTAAPADPTAAQLAGVAATPWAVTDAAVDGTPQPPPRAGLPPTLCVARGVDTGATVVLTGTAAVRHYVVGARSAGPGADLVLVDCATTPPRPLAAARLQDTQTVAPLLPATVRAITVADPTSDPSAIPATQMAITLDLALPDAQDGVLVLARGARVAASAAQPTADGTRLTYLVPLASAPQVAGWWRAQAGALPQHLALTLPAPTERAALLREVLDVQLADTALASAPTGPTLTLTLTLTLAADAAPRTLAADDLTAVTGDLPFPIAWTPPALTPGVPTRVVVRVGTLPRTPVELALAGWRVRLTTERPADP